MGELYRTDLALWAAQQANALRSAARDGSNVAVDWENVAEEIESLGASERRALASHIGVIIEHLMKLQASPATRPRGGWRQSVLRSRSAILLILDDSPSLRREVPLLIARQTPRMIPLVTEALGRQREAPRVDPATLAFSEDQILGPWLPD